MIEYRCEPYLAQQWHNRGGRHLDLPLAFFRRFEHNLAVVSIDRTAIHDVLRTLQDLLKQSRKSTKGEVGYGKMLADEAYDLSWYPVGGSVDVTPLQNSEDDP